MPRTGWGIWHELGHCFFTASIAQSSVLYCAPAPGLIELWLLWKKQGLFFNYWQYNITLSLFRTGIHSNDKIHSICGLGSDLSVKDTKWRGHRKAVKEMSNLGYCDVWWGRGSTLNPKFLVNFTKNYFTQLPCYDWFSWDNQWQPMAKFGKW